VRWGIPVVRFAAISALFGIFAMTASPSSAGAVLIDFTDAVPWGGAENQTRFSTNIGDLTVTLTAYRNGSPHPMTFNNSASEMGGCADGHGGASPLHNLACDGDGIGIKGTTENSGAYDDEITGNASEKLLVTFSRPIPLLNIELLDLFNNNTELETALIKLDDGSWNSFVSTNKLGGYHSTNLGGAAVSRITFKAYNDAVSDYAVARLSIYMADVPEPATSMLFMFGLAGLKAIRRRRRAHDAAA